MGFIDEIKAKAKTCKKTIVLPETEDIRTYEAAEAVLKEGTANLILIGSEEEIAKNKGSFDISGATIVDPATYEKTDAYIATLVELRQKKGSFPVRVLNDSAEESAIAASFSGSGFCSSPESAKINVPSAPISQSGTTITKNAETNFVPGFVFKI